MEGTRPDWRARSVNAQEVNWVPWSECMTVPVSGWRLLIAMPRAEVTSPEVAELSIDHTDDSAAEHVEDDRAVDLSFSGWVLCDVGDP